MRHSRVAPSVFAIGLLFLGIAIATTSAAELHVAASGSDAKGNGSAAKPYREIRKALESVKPGDTILVADGQYAGFTLRDTRATEAKPIVIKATGKKAEVMPTTDRGDNRDTMYLDACAWITLDGLRSFKANRAAVRLEAADHITVRNGVYGNNALWGIFTGHCDDLVIENNECYGSVNQHGIYVGNSGDRPIIRGNHCHDNAGCGIHMNADLSCGGDGLITGALVEGNLVHGNGRKGGAAINMDGIQDSVIQHNLLYDNHASGIVGFRDCGAAGPKGLVIRHNTIVMASDARYALQLGQTAGPNTVRNNILYSLSPKRGGLAYFAADDVANVDSDGNVFGAEAPIVALKDWNDRRAFEDWQKQGHEKHSLVSIQAALFVDASKHDYRPKPGSPALGKAVAMPAATGSAIPGASADIGCRELPRSP